MSVMECDRQGCDNVCCSRFNHKRQEYICYSCFKELVTLGPLANLDDFMAGTLVLDIDHDASHAYFDVLYPEMS